MTNPTQHTKRQIRNRLQLGMLLAGVALTLLSGCDDKPKAEAAPKSSAAASAKSDAKPKASAAAKKEEKKADDKGSSGVDHSDPAAVTQAVFDGFKNDDPSKFAGLCDPKGENDGDTRRICQMKKDSPKWAEYKAELETGKLNGEPKIEGDKASVDFLFGKDGKKPETMKLVKRDDKWYLSSF